MSIADLLFMTTQQLIDRITSQYRFSIDIGNTFQFEFSNGNITEITPFQGNIYFTYNMNIFGHGHPSNFHVSWIDLNPEFINGIGGVYRIMDLNDLSNSTLLRLNQIM
jgi:hypothetical protein